MMKFYEYPDRNDWARLMERSGTDDPFMEKLVRKILSSVKKEGDTAVEKYTRLFDKQYSSRDTLSKKLKDAIHIARQNIETFHKAQLPVSKSIETMPGVTCWQETRAIERVGLYIPGGTAPLFSTILMLAVPARIAGCKEIILCSPSDHPAIHYTARLCGINTIYKVGGAQAIAAMAYGTGSIPKVDKIFGPGNQYVTLAKQLVQLEGVAIDMPAGPSELLIIADNSAVPEFIAADLLSQAEHSEDAQVMLLTDSRELIVNVRRCIAEQVKDLSRQQIIKTSLLSGQLILLRSISDAVLFSNQYAPEHLILATREDISKEITSAGSVFIGNYSPESAGDYASGTNHTLPTNGYAAAYSGVTIESFQKKISFQKLSKQGLKHISSAVISMAEAEGLDAHSNAIKIRL